MYSFVRTFFVGTILLLLLTIAQSTQAITQPYDDSHDTINSTGDKLPVLPSTNLPLLDTAAATPVAITPKIASSFMAPGNRALAITWGNNSLWLADANKNVYRLNDKGEEIQPSFPITFTPFGLAWDGANLWSGNDFLPFGSWRAFQLSATGRVVGGATGTWEANYIDSLAWIGNFLYASDTSPGLIHKLTRSGTHLLSWEPDFIGMPKGMAYDGTGLWIGENCFGDARNDLYRYSLLGERLNSIDLNAIGINCSFNTQTTRGLAWDGQFLWYTGNDIFTVYKLDIGVPDLTVAPTQLAFGTVSVNSTVAQTITVKNVGATGLPFNSFSVSPAFAQTNTCPSGATTLAGGASCTIRVAFTPLTAVNYTDALTITNFVGVTPHVVTMTGNGTGTSNGPTLQLNRVGNGKVTPNPAGPYVNGQSVTLTATPDTGWTFTGWSGDLTGSVNPITFNITKATVVTANFAAPCYTLTLTHTGSGSDPVATPANSPNCASGQYSAGAALTLSASPAAGWQVSGWSGTINDNSTATSNSLTMPPSNHTVGVTYTETISTAPKSWTLLIYAVGDNDRVIADFLQSMLTRLAGVGAQAHVNVAILYDGIQPNETARYILNQTGQPLQRFPIEEARMDEMATLRDFVRWSFATLPVSDYYYLAIADHANGIAGIGQDKTTDSTGAAFLTPNEVRTALTEALAGTAHRLHIVHFDGCSFGLFENSAIVEGIADYVIASPNTGWGVFAYDEYRAAAGQPVNDPATVATAIAQRYAKKLKGYPYTISVFDMNHYTAVRTATDALGDALVTYLTPDPRNRFLLLRSLVRQDVQKYDSSGGDLLITENDSYVDLRGLAQALKLLGEQPVEAAAEQVRNATEAFIHFEDHNSGEHNGKLIDLAKAQGLGIYYPFDIPTKEYQAYIGHTSFPNLTKVSDTENWGWRDFLSRLPPLPREPVEEAPLIPPLAVPEFSSYQLFLPTATR